MKCVKIGKKHADRPLLHRKMGTITIANFHRRKLLSPALEKLTIVKACADLSNPTQSKHVRWAKPIKREYSFIAASPSVDDDVEPQQAETATKVRKSMSKAAKKLTPYYCSDCQQYFYSRKFLKRHVGTQKHLMQVTRQSSYAGNLQALEKSEQVEAATADDEMDTIDIVTKPMGLPLFYCSDCYQYFRTQNWLNSHMTTKKHQNTVFDSLRLKWRDSSYKGN